MSVDWEFCIVHSEPPNFNAVEMLKLLDHLESAGYLQNIAFKAFREEDKVALDDLTAVAQWLNDGPGSWDTVSCDYKLWGLASDESVSDRHPVFAKLSEELMDNYSDEEMTS